jgi:hypothetical protein
MPLVETRPFDYANQVGCLVLDLADEGIEGRLLARFSHSIAIQVGSLILSLTELAGGLPLGISVHSLPASLDRSWIGSKVFIDPRNVIVDDAGYQINLEKAQIWDAKSRISKTEPETIGMRMRFASVQGWIVDRELTFGMGFMGSENALEGVQKHDFEDLITQLRLALSPVDRPSTDRSADRYLNRVLKQILGMGPGLTPSGDDFLVGLLLCLWAGEHLSPVLENIRKSLASKILDLGQRHTNSFAWSYLYSACKGHGAQVLVDFLESMIAGTQDPREAALRLSKIGGSSGTDTLLGIMMGLQCFVIPEFQKAGSTEPN